MCNTCGCRNTCGCNGNGRGGNGCGCVNLCSELAQAINNLFADPCNRGCGCGCRHNCGCCHRCGCNQRGNGCGCGCGCNRTADLSALTDCGNFDAYYARQYGLTGRGSCCVL